MNFGKILKGTALGLACIGMVMPCDALVAAEQARKTTQAPVVSSVALNGAGVFNGQLITAEGKAIDGAKVVVRSNGKAVATAVTDAKGSFKVANLKAGVYEISAGQAKAVYQVWPSQTAPPSANKQALMISGKQVVRGQVAGLDVVTVSLLAVTGTALGFSISNNSKLNDLEDQVNKIPTSP